jgi:hypothetical protein
MPSPSRFSGASMAQATATPGRDAPDQQSTSPLQAVEHIRRMRGGARAQLMRCSDGHCYVVKFQNNPQDRRVLANELLGTQLARLLGLPTATPAIVYISEDLIRMTDELRVEYPRWLRGCSRSGPQFGSRYIGDWRRCVALDILSDNLLRGVENLKTFAGMLVFDKWTCNTDGRQVVFQRKNQRYEAVMIDQGFCFSSGDWAFPDAPLRGRYARTCVYDGIRGIDDFEPWLSRLESQIGEHAIWGCGAEIPPEWYESDSDALAHLLETLNKRRSKVRELLWSIRGCKDFLRTWVERTVVAAD